MGVQTYLDWLLPITGTGDQEMFLQMKLKTPWCQQLTERSAELSSSWFASSSYQSVDHLSPLKHMYGVSRHMLASIMDLTYTQHLATPVYY